MSNTCPKCGGRVRWDYDCHTYQSNGRWMSCLPCDSAISYTCASCDWHFIHGLNPGNPRTEENEKNRPDWLVGPLEWNKAGKFGISSPIIMEGIQSFWEDDDDDDAVE